MGEDDITTTVEKLMKTVKKFDLDNSMLTALQTALSKPPSNRGPFDVCVVTQFDDAVKVKVEECAKTLSSAEPTKVKLQAAVQAAEKQLEDALVVLKRSAGIFETAQDAKDSS